MNGSNCPLLLAISQKDFTFRYNSDNIDRGDHMIHYSINQSIKPNSELQKVLVGLPPL
jgi:hypothetical protein